MRSLARLIGPARLTRSRRAGVGLVAAGLLVVASTSTAVVAASRDSAGTSPLAVTSAPVGGALATLGDQVWLDADHDGLQDAGEEGVNGLTVTLLDDSGTPVSADGNGDPVQPATTQPSGGRDGTYRFADLAPGSYAVEVSGLPAGHRFTLQGSDPDDGTDSNADPITGRTPVVDLAAGEVDDTVDAGIWEPTPALVVETRAQGSDADDPPGPSVPIGDPVAFDHLVTNTGNEALDALAVTDDQGVAVSCPQTTIAVLETVACQGSTPALSGAHTHVGTAEAEGQESGETATASDPATYTGVLAGLDVEKTVDGADADTAAAAPDVAVGATVTFGYTVTNTGSDDLTGLTVVDDVLGPVTCPQTDLGPGESVTCTDLPATAASGLNTNVATASATAGAATGGEPVGDTDPATYRGVDARIGLLKEVLDPGTGQYLDADADDGSPGTNDGVPAVLLSGADARYRLQVVNEGNLALTDVEVVDDRCDAAPQLVGGDAAPPDVLDVGETWVLTCTRSGITTDLTNTATVTATSTAGPPAGNGASERAAVEVAGEAAVDLDKQVALPGGGYSDTATLPSGSTATFRIEVTNGGQAPLIDLVVTDPRAPDCDRTLAGPLAVGASEAWTCTLGPVTASLTNTASVLAQPQTGADPVTATDGASIDVVTPTAPDLTLAKAVDSTDAAARTATFRLTVRNAGPGTAPGPIHVVDTLPTGLSHRSASGAGWSCAASGQTVTCSHAADLAEAESSSVWLEVAVADGLGEATNHATVSGVADSNPTNDDASAVLALDTTPPGGGGGGGGGGAGGTDGGTGGQGAGHGPLAMTGAEILGLLLLGVSLVGIGVIVLIASRRRQDVAGDAGGLRPEGLAPPAR